MFVGSINQDLRSFVAEITRSWDVTDIYVGCSGNFTIERILKERGFNLHGNDVSIYSVMLGKYLAGEPMNMAIRMDEFRWLEDYMEEGIPRIATVLLCTTMLENLHRDEPYFTRRRSAYKKQWPRLHAETCVKVEKALHELKLASFYAGDVVEFTNTAPRDQAYISFPPTYSGGYEKLYKALNDVFEWDEPVYEMFTPESFGSMLYDVMEMKHWIISSDKPLPELEGYEVGTVQTSLRSKPVVIYSDQATKRITMPHQKTELLKVNRMGPEDEITENSKITLKKITQAQMNTLRSLYLNAGIAPAAAGVNLAILIDGKLIGAMGLSKSTFGAGIYLMSDFVIRPLGYKRASKLVLACVLSIEVKRICEQMINQKVDIVQTTAFTDKPVSMKYRGLFDLTSRKENPNRLNYSSAAGQWTLQEALATWVKKHSKA